LIEKISNELLGWARKKQDWENREFEGGVLLVYYLWKGVCSKHRISGRIVIGFIELQQNSAIDFPIMMTIIAYRKELQCFLFAFFLLHPISFIAKYGNLDGVIGFLAPMMHCMTRMNSLIRIIRSC